MKSLGGGGTEVVRNGVRPGIERLGTTQPLARGEVTVGYFGYLASAWFDWELVAAAAALQPTWRFYMIGYGGAPEGVMLPPNVSLLGRRPQHELAGLASGWDVAIVPFKDDPLAAGADPIKTYEYLAMGLPVVITGVHPPPGAESFVTRTASTREFVDAIAAAAALPQSAGLERRAFAATCTWDSRLDALLASLDAGRQRVAEKRALLP
jgi:glycosyltransferase involved in cell wall biosynthesis